MRKNAIIRIIIFSLAILVLLSVLGVGIALKYYSFERHEYTAESSTGTADASQIRNLSIQWAAGTITIHPADVTELTFTESLPEGADPMVWVQSGDTLKLAYAKDETVISVSSIPRKDLTIEVPRDWVCRDLEVDAAAADLMMYAMVISSIDFDGASGAFLLSGCTVDTLDIDTASGDVRFSGSLNALECDAVSANCGIVATNYPRSIDMDIMSGDLTLTLPEDCGFTVKLEALSGDLGTDFPVEKTKHGFRSGDGACEIELNALSGNVTIRKPEAN